MQATVAVFGPVSWLTVTVERDPSGSDENHFHGGGQAIWVARAAHRLGETVAVCTPLGGESGAVVDALVRREGLQLHAVRTAASTPSYIHDRRGGVREPIAATLPHDLTRHETDDLYDHALALALSTDVLVVTGRSPGSDSPPVDFYRRMGADLAKTEVRVVADLHGPELAGFLQEGRIGLLKVSDEDLEADGSAVGDPPWETLEQLCDRGVEHVVLSRGTEPTMAIVQGNRMVAMPPPVAPADHRGSGDAMTGALAVGVVRGLAGSALLALGCAAGAASATRHGLATADAHLIAELAHRTEVRRLS